MPLLRKPRDGIALGGQQAQRLHQLRLVSEKHIHEQHLYPLEAVKSPHSTRQTSVLSPTFGHSARASRTVEAIIESRAIEKDDESAPSKATRLRETIRGARGGFHTERSEETRPRTTLPVPTTAPQKSVSRPTSHALGSNVSRPTPGLTQRIATMRRRHGGAVDTSQRRKLTREELEWIEKQLQFTQRVGLLEKECATWWQSFYASASNISGGSVATESSEETKATTLAIQKQVEESDRRRRHDTQELQQHIHGLREQADAVMDMVCRMRDGVGFIADLQDAMDAFENDLSRFRVAQREQFDSYVLDEKLIERDLTEFLDKVDSWELQEQERKKRLPKSALKTKKTAPVLSRSASGVPEEPDGGSERRSDQPQEVPGRSEVDLVKRVRMLNQQIVESGGLKGGWDDREHAVFASVFLKYGLTDEIVLANYIANAGENQKLDGPSEEYETLVARAIRKCVQGIVTKTENAVRNHFDWYLGHLRLVQEKKDAIAQWKQKKEAGRQQLIRQGLHQVDADRISGSMGEDIAATAATVDQFANEEKKMKRTEQLEAKEREKQAKELEKWREEKERRANEELEQERERRAQREAREAKKRQELLEKKQQLLLYKLQKEQETSMLQRNRSAGGGGGSRSPPGSQSPGPSNEELMERSRKAIEQAKAKRAQLQAIEERRLKQQELPERPKSITKRKTSASRSAASPTDSEGSPSARYQTLLKPTKAFEARHLSKLELKRKEKQRATQGAHDAYFPGAGMISDVKIKSFGHISIAPRAVPSWRRNV